ncbi:MAG: hypothetical protein DPW18_12455 [Chloroflexi bacterium]|nr:MAG: NAD-dependent epimerase/dehydratase family protein [Chloroflexota bacterium]MCQ3937844.1 hypothetical protein [Chloroflexota bacterium]MDL1941712.1 NAD-dependent epimerase/dehydratase family protein [Chloroflexi bacterium CFX2]
MAKQRKKIVSLRNWINQIRRSNEICIIGASGKLGRCMIEHALDRGYEVSGVCQERNMSKLDAFKRRITLIPGATNDRAVIEQAVAGCDGVLTALVPGNQH